GRQRPADHRGADPRQAVAVAGPTDHRRPVRRSARAPRPRAAERRLDAGLRGDRVTEPLDIEETRRRLQEAEELLHAIRTGEVDALVIQRSGGGAAEEVYTLESADRPYRMLVEEMEEAALTLTPAGDVLYCNRRFAQLVNTPIEKIRGGPVTRYISEDDRLAFAALLSVGRGKHSGHLVAAGGTRVPVCLAVNKLMWAGVESLGLLVTDLSEITRSEIARADAEADSRAKDEFIAMLGHELRNPLGAIRSALAVLQQVGPREER